MLCSQLQISAQHHDFPYRFSRKDFAIAPVASLAYFGGEYLSDRTDFYIGTEEIRKLDRTDINALDRPATYNWNRGLNNVSDVFAEALPIIPAFIILPKVYKREWGNMAVFGLMYLEVYFLTKGTTVLTKSVTGRTRPYLYNTAFTPEERFAFQGNEAPEANSSFFSGHTSDTFAGAVFLSKTFTDIYGKSVWSKIIWATSFSAAIFTAYCRVAAGEHFTTDVLAGALIGSAIGYFIPVLHNKMSHEVSWSVMPNSFSLTYNF